MKWRLASYTPRCNFRTSGQKGELLADQMDADPLGTLTKLKAYLPIK